MLPVLIVKNCSREGPGLLETVLSQRQIPSVVVDLERGETFPSPKSYGAVIVLGGPQSANARTREMRHSLERIEETLKLQIPYLGICLGLQLLVKAAGGKVKKNGVREIGFRDSNGEFYEVELTQSGLKDPVLRGLPKLFRVFHIHGETVELTEGMTLLGRGKTCTHQIVKVANQAYGLQGHVELTDDIFRTWMNEDEDLRSQSKTDLDSDYRLNRERLMETGTRLFENFVSMSSDSLGVPFPA